MLEEIKIYLLVFSIVFVLRYVSEFILKLFQEEPIPMKLNQIEQISVYITLSYIITFLII